MKELSIEEKAKRYDEALEKSKILYEQGTITESLCYVFPELQESEDENIRKKLIHLVKKSHEQGGYALHKWESDEMLAWLEKQGEHAKFRDSIQIGDKVTRNEDGVLVNMSQLKRVAKPAEVQGEQKPVDKVEPKFKVGDWLQYRNAKPFLVEEITQQGYVNGISCLPFEWENEIHLWSIQDAKDGDVLSSEDKDKVFLYNGKFDLRGRVCAYCGIYKTYDGLRFTECAIGNYFTYKEPYPATKEQRDLLFQKMKEAGLEWDAENKELKKIKYPRMICLPTL